MLPTSRSLPARGAATRRRPRRRGALGAILAALLGALVAAPAALGLSGSPVPSAWAVNGQVLAVMPGPAGTAFVGGSFDVVGPASGGAVPTDPTTGAMLSGFPQVVGTVNAIAPDGSGGWYVGGRFSAIGGQSIRNLAHVNADLSVDTTWTPAPNGMVDAITVANGTVYVGGAFSRIGGQVRSGVGALAADGTATSWNPNANGAVDALAVSGSTVYVGGSFTSIGGQARNFAAALDATSGAATAWNPDPNGVVNALAVNASTVYAGGSFTMIGGASRPYIGAVDTVAGAANAWNPNASGPVNALAVSGAAIYAAGSFNVIGGQVRANLAQVSLSTGAATAWNPGADGPVDAIAVGSSGVYVGGAFANAGGAARPNAAALDPSTGAALAWNPRPGRTVQALAVSPSAAYVGGTFSVVNGQARANIAQIDLTDDTATSWNPGADGPVSALAWTGTTLYAGGSFANLGGQARANIGALTPGSSAATSWNPSANGPVSALAWSGGTLYIGGTFSVLGGQTRNNLGAVADGSSTATGWSPNANNTVNALAVSGSTVYAGGAFTSMGGVTRNRIAAVDASAGTVTPWNPSADGNVNALAVGATSVYAGGTFANIGGQARSDIAELLTGANANNASDWDPSANGPVNALAIGSDGTVYAAGGFTTIGGATRARLAGIDPSSGAATSWNPGADATANALASLGGDLLVGGAFDAVSGASRGGFADFVGNPVNLVAPAISGTPQVGQTLSCSTGTWQGVPTSYAYQWSAAGNPIAGATASTYTVDLSVAGQDVTCTVTATNIGGSASATSAPVHIQGKPVNTAPPTISGTPGVGLPLTCSPGTWQNSPTYAYAWLRDGTAISGATNASYTVVTADAGHQIVCEVSATNPAGTVTADSAAVAAYGAPQAQTPPSITGTVALGATLTCQPATWQYPVASTAYAWLRDGTPIAGQTSQTYVIGSADPGHALTCQITATNAAGSGTSTSAPLAVPAPPANTALPTVSGTPGVGQTLTCQPGTWANPVSSRSYQWDRDGTPIFGQTGTTYTVATADAGHQLDCQETATSPTGSTSATSAAVSAFAAPVNQTPPTVAGAPGVGLTVTCDIGTWQYPITSQSFAWLRDGTAIAGQTASTYTVAAGDAGHTLSCTATVGNIAGSSSATSATVTAYAAPVSQTPPAISGTPGVGLQLTCTPGTWQYPVGSDTIAWLRDGTPIAGASGTTYTLVSADAGHQIACQETATNPAGATSANSSSLSAFAAPQSLTAPTISGDPGVGETLTCTPGTWQYPVDTTAVAWLRDGTPIASATNATYTVAAGDAGHQIACQQTATNAAGTTAATSTAVNAYAAPLSNTAPTVQGPPAVGQEVTCQPGTWQYPVVSESYQWFRDGSPIAGATDQTYQPLAADAGHQIACQETVTNAVGSSSAISPSVGAYAAPLLDAPPGLSGQPGVGQTLTCTDATWTYPVGSLAYQWLRDGSPIAGATAGTYTVTSADAGHYLRCRQTATNPAGTGTGLSGSLQAYGAPVLATPVAMSGTPQVGQSLSCTAATWTTAAPVASVQRAWLRDGQPIAGATGATYTVASADAGHQLACQDTAVNAAGSTPSTSPGVAAYGTPIATTLPSVTGNAYAGQRLTCQTGTWIGGATSTYVDWLLDGTPVVGVVGPTYLVSPLDVGHSVQCRVSETNSLGTTRASSAAVSPYAAPVSVAPPDVQGTPAVGQTLTCVPGTWQYPVASDTISWLRDGTPIGGASGATYTLTTADAGHGISCGETAANPAGSTGVASIVLPAHGVPVIQSAPSIAGTPVVGATLTCQAGTYLYPVDTRTYDWIGADGSVLATGRTYAVAPGEAGAQVRCREYAANEAGTTLVTAAAVTINPPASPDSAPSARTRPRIVGTRVVGALLACRTGAWSGGSVIGVQWLRGEAPIAGATRRTHRLVADDAPAGVTCAVTARGPGGDTVATVKSGPVPSLLAAIPAATLTRVGDVQVVLPRALSRGALRRTRAVRFRVSAPRAAVVRIRMGGRKVTVRLHAAGTTPLSTLHIAARPTARMHRLSFRIELLGPGGRVSLVRRGSIVLTGRLR